MVNHKNKNYEYFIKKYPEFEHTISRFNDYVMRVVHNQKVVETRFLSKMEQEILVEMAKEIDITFDGGFENANYKKALLSPKSFYLKSNPEVMVLKAVCSPYHTILHKDVLGYILNLGIMRNRIGDILINDNQIFVACDKEVVELIKMSDKIKREKIIFNETDEKVTLTPKFERMERIISSFRLDVIVSAIANVSRNQALQLIQAKDVKVNTMIKSDKSFLCNIDDEIVIRRYGKYRLFQIKNITKKENIVLEINKYI